MDIKKLSFLMELWNENSFKEIESPIFQQIPKVFVENAKQNSYYKYLSFPTENDEAIYLTMEISDDFFEDDTVRVIFDISGVYKDKTGFLQNEIILSKHIDELKKVIDTTHEIIAKMKNLIKTDSRFRVYHVVHGKKTISFDNYIRIRLNHYESKLKKDIWKEKLGLRKERLYGQTNI